MIISVCAVPEGGSCAGACFKKRTDKLIEITVARITHAVCKDGIMYAP